MSDFCIAALVSTHPQTLPLSGAGLQQLVLDIGSKDGVRSRLTVSVQEGPH